MLGGADNSNGELPSYIIGANIIVDPMLTSELRYGDLWSMREFNHFDFELNGIIRAFFTHCG